MRQPSQFHMTVFAFFSQVQQRDAVSGVHLLAGLDLRQGPSGRRADPPARGPYHVLHRPRLYAGTRIKRLTLLGPLCCEHFCAFAVFSVGGNGRGCHGVAVPRHVVLPLFLGRNGFLVFFFI